MQIFFSFSKVKCQVDPESQQVERQPEQPAEPEFPERLANISSRSEANPTNVILKSILPQSDTELDELPKEDSNGVSKRNLPDLDDPQLVKNRTPQQEMVENSSATPPEATTSNFFANHFENCLPRSSMALITTTNPGPSNSACWDASSLLRTICVNSTEPATSAMPSTEAVQLEVVFHAEKGNQLEVQPASSDKNMAVVATLSSKTPTAESELPEAMESQMIADVVETDKAARSLLPSEKSPKSRKFLARVQGLPETILAVFPNKVLFKHPFDPD